MLACLALAAGTCVRASAAAIPEGTALWFACTEKTFTGPLSLRCPRPYDPRYLQTFLNGFSRLTPENEFKMAYLEPQEYRFNFTVADQVAAFARAHRKTIRGHTLLWNRQQPFWLLHPLLDWTRRSMAEVMYTYITDVVSHFAAHYPGVVTEWDVVNEPLNQYGGLAWSPWEAAVGADYIRDALIYAHAADPNVKLVINENGADLPSPKEAALLSLATHLKATGAPLDGVGFEAHTTPDTAPTLAELLWLYRQYRQAGLTVEITELDVADDGGVDDRAAKLEVFRRYAQACRMSPNCSGLTVWGVSNQYSWLGAAADALLYGTDFSPSPVVAEINNLLSSPSATASSPATTVHSRTRAKVRTVPRRRLRLPRSAG